MKDWHKLKPELFKKNPYYLTGCDIYPPAQWPSWAEISLDGSLNGRWPWAQPETKEHLLQEARKIA
jgi:hypothetical protein